MASTPPPRQTRSRGAWWVFPAIIVGFILVAWLLVARMPVGDSEGRITLEETSTVGETPVADPGTVVDASPGAPGTQGQSPMVIEEVGQPGVGTVIQPGVPQTAVINPPPPVPPAQQIPLEPQQPAQSADDVWRPSPDPSRTTTLPPQTSASTSTEDGRGISGQQAVSIVRNYVVGRSFYNVETSCVSVRGGNFRNEGYDVDVWDTCVQGGGSKRLGRWRVDAKTGEIYRQRADGRYLSP